MVDTQKTKCQCDCHNQQIGWDSPVVTMLGMIPDTLVSRLLGIHPEGFRSWCVDHLVTFIELHGVLWMRSEEVKQLILTGKGSRKTEAS